MHALLWTLLALAAIPLLGALYQALAAWHDRRTLTRAGRFVRLHNRQVYVQQMGADPEPGSPTIVFESGLVASTLNWLTVQQAVAHSAATFSYDRPGLGWSDAAVETPRTPAVLAEELHAILRAAGVEPPYLFVAHSFGALIVRFFALRYPSEIAGILLLDPMRTEGWLPSNVPGQAIMRGGRNLMRRAILPTRLGLTRIATQSLLHPRPWKTWLMNTLLGKPGKRSADRMTRELHKMPLNAQPAVVAQWSRPQFWAGSDAHIRAIPTGIEQLQRHPAIIGIPTVIARPEAGPENSPAHAHATGPSVTEVTVAQSGHWLHLDQPQAVIDLITKQLHTLENSSSSSTATHMQTA